MNIKSLMIGDWVKIKTYGVSDKYERTEAYIYVKVAEIGSGLITVEYNNDIKEPYRICENTEIEPIPLTPEILEKNGFTKELDDDSIHCRYTLIADGIRFSLKYALSVFQWLGPLDFKYVHELQHALRFCGIKKDIQL